jgi:hypothetical protein
MPEAIATQTNASLDVLRFQNENTLTLDETLHITPTSSPASSWTSEKYDVFGTPSIALLTSIIANEVPLESTTWGVSVEESLDGEIWTAIPPEQFSPALTSADLTNAGDVLSLKMYLRTHYIRVVFYTHDIISGTIDIEFVAQIQAGEA